MGIHTTTTTEGEFQVLNAVAIVPPMPPGVVEGNVHEQGTTQIPIGQQSLTITFAVVKSSANYEFEVLEVENTVDPDPFILSPEISAYSTTGFTVVFNGVPDTGSYYLRWDVVI